MTADKKANDEAIAKFIADEKASRLAEDWKKIIAEKTNKVADFKT